MGSAAGCWPHNRANPRNAAAKRAGRGEGMSDSSRDPGSGAIVDFYYRRTWTRMLPCSKFTLGTEEV